MRGMVGPEVCCPAGCDQPCLPNCTASWPPPSSPPQPSHLVVAQQVGAVGGAQHHAVDGAALLAHHPVLGGRAQLLRG